MIRSGTLEPALVTKVEAARLLGISRYTLYELVKRGVLVEVTIAEGMNPRLRRADVLALADVKDESRLAAGSREHTNVRGPL